MKRIIKRQTMQKHSIHLSRLKNRLKSLFQKQYVTHPNKNGNSNIKNQSNSINYDLEKTNKQTKRQKSKKQKRKQNTNNRKTLKKWIIKFWDF